MFFIDKNQAQIGKGRKQGGTGTDDNGNLPFFRPFKLVKTLPFGKPGIYQRHTVAKAPIKPGHILIGQGNFRNQHNDLLSLFQHMGNEFHVNFRFSASRHPFYETGTGMFRFPFCKNFPAHLFLRRAQRRDFQIFSVFPFENRISIIPLPLYLKKAFFLQSPYN